MHVPEQCGGDVSPKHCAKVGAASCRRRRVMGEGLGKFHRARRVTKC